MRDGESRTGRVEKTEGIGLITNHDRHGVIVEYLRKSGRASSGDEAEDVLATHGRNILAREFVRGIGYEQTCLFS